MILHHQIVYRAKENGASIVPGLRSESVVDLLTGQTSPGAAPVARTLLRRMAQEPWRVVRGIHVSASDGTRHITLRMAGRGYHLRVDARDCIFDITRAAGEAEEGVDRLGHRAPWDVRAPRAQ